eukprot:1730551-Amphidinium_carterae.1
MAEMEQMQRTLQALMERQGALEQKFLTARSQQQQAQQQQQQQAQAAQQHVRPGIIDTRTLSRPETFTGDHTKWRDWRAVMKAYTGAISPRMGELMTQVETTNVLNEAMDPSDRGLSTQLYYMLVMSTKNTALDLTLNAGELQGFSAWHALVQRFEPEVTTRYAGALMTLLGFQFNGTDFVSQLETFERDMRQWERESGESVSDMIRMGIVLKGMPDGHLRRSYGSIYYSGRRTCASGKTSDVRRGTCIWHNGIDSGNSNGCGSSITGLRQGREMPSVWQNRSQ